MKEITLNSFTLLKALVDDEDYEKVMRYKRWRLQQHGGHAVAGSTSMKMHDVVFPVDSGFEVDHIDGNPLNNQKSNLRQATRKQNLQNRRTSQRSTTGYKGVSYNKACAKYAASIKTDKVKQHLGLFATAEEAAHAYDAKAKELFGEFARLNF